MSTEIERVTEVLEALPDDATAEEVFDAIAPYSKRAVAAATFSLTDGGGGGSLPSGAGSPTGNVTPSGIGALYIDTDGGALYIATGTTDTDWLQVGRDLNGVGPSPGFVRTTDGSGVAVVGGTDSDAPGGSVLITDAYTQWNGGAFGVTWSAGGTDGDQTLSVKVAGGITLFSADGNVTFPGTVGTVKGFIFPVEDPLVTGAWWDDNGVLTPSAGP